MIRRSMFLAGIALIAAPIAAQTAPTFDPARLAKHVQTLGSDAFEGRGPATAGETKTVDYLTRELRAAGVQPGGDLVDGKRQWTQAVPLLRSEFVAAPQASLTIAGQADGPDPGRADRRPLPDQRREGDRPRRRAASCSSATGSRRRSGTGTISRASTLAARSWSLFVNDPDFEGGEGDFGGKAMTYYGRWTYKYEEAARLGAKGVLVIHETDPASYGWATVKNSNTNAMFDIVRKNPAAEHPLLEGWIQRDLAAQIFAASGTSFEAMKAAAKRRDFKPVPLKASLDVNGSARDRGHHLEKCRRNPARRGAARRNRDLLRPLGPSRHRPSRCEGRPDL